MARNGGPEQLNEVDLPNSRILLLRQNMIGDALISTPVIAALRARFPNMVIDVVLDKRNQTVFNFDKNIATRHVLKLRKFDIFQIIRNIRAQRYDVIVDLIHSPSSTSTAICWLGKPSVTIGPERSNDFIYDIKVSPVSKMNPDERMMFRIAEVLRPFGINPDPQSLQPYFSLSPEAEDFGREMGKRVRGDDPARIAVGINISGSKPEKYWGTENFISLINALSDNFPNAVFVILNSREYEAQAASIVDATSATTSGTTKTLHDFAACIGNVDILISTDSSAVHFADIAGVPVVDLVRDPDKRLWLPSKVNFRSVHGPDRTITSIPVTDVMKAFDELAAETFAQN